MSQVFRNLTLATMQPGEGYGLMRDAAVITEHGRITYVGPASGAPASAGLRIDCGGRLVTPALIDCHTHLVHGGNRAQEFEKRLNGISYEEIARAGGGIMSTVQATRAATEAELLAKALYFVDALTREGVGVIEIKSGYGLDLETELKMLRVGRRIAMLRPLRIVTSFLGAHAVPEGISADAYIDDICLPTLNAAHAQGLVDAVDGFCEGIAFSPAQIARVFDRAQVLGLPVRLHAEQLSHLGGTELAARYGALSADHVEYVTEDDARAMAASGTVAVLLPGAFYTLRETQCPPVDAFRKYGVPMALATDSNPGSSPMVSLLLAMNMGCTLFGLTPVEALAGVTRNAARALGLTDCGMVAPGMRADLAVWDVEHPAELAYRFGYSPLHARYYGGQI